MIYSDRVNLRAWLGKVIEHCPYDSGVVVVGNIHETPELLEGKK